MGKIENKMYIGNWQFDGYITNARGTLPHDLAFVTKNYVDKTPYYFTGDGTATEVTIPRAAIFRSTLLQGNGFTWDLDREDGTFPDDLRRQQFAYREHKLGDGRVVGLTPLILFPEGVKFTLLYTPYSL